MKNRLDAVTAISAVGVAAYVAVAIGYVARYDLGFSSYQICGTALIAAVLIAALIAIEFSGKTLGRAK